VDNSQYLHMHPNIIYREGVSIHSCRIAAVSHTHAERLSARLDRDGAASSLREAITLANEPLFPGLRTPDVRENASVQ